MTRIQEHEKLLLSLVPLVTGVFSLALGILSLKSSAARVYVEDGQYLVSVRYPGQWLDIRDFVTPDDRAVKEEYAQIGPDIWQTLDYVCQTISYRRDIGEFWQFPSETLAWGKAGDCEDSSILTCSLLSNFTDAYVAVGTYHGYGHAWCYSNGEILETTYTRARPVPDPLDYHPYFYFNQDVVIELWPDALWEILGKRRNEPAKFALIAQALGA